MIFSVSKLEIFCIVNIDVHSRRLIYESPGDGVKFISELQLNCANMNFSNRSKYDRLFQQVTRKGGGVRNEIHQDISKYTGFISFSGKQLD